VWDTSEHDWLEGRGPKLYPVAMIDDATSLAYARFVSHDSTEENLRTIQVLLGHRKIERTTIYLRLSRKHLTAVANPLDTI
jgi:hypothetical protein